MPAGLFPGIRAGLPLWAPGWLSGGPSPPRLTPRAQSFASRLAIQDIRAGARMSRLVVHDVLWAVRLVGRDVLGGRPLALRVHCRAGPVARAPVVRSGGAALKPGKCWNRGIVGPPEYLGFRGVLTT